MSAKCVECGLLQILTTGTREFVAVEPDIRNTGQIPQRLVPKIGWEELYERKFECLAGKPVRAEIDAVPEGVSWLNHFKAVIARERTECADDFIRFQPGLSPKDHREMKLLAEVERRNAAWRQEEQDRSQRWRAEEQERAAAWRAEEIERAQGWREEDIEWREQTEARLIGQHWANYLLKGLEILCVVAASVIASLVAIGKIELW